MVIPFEEEYHKKFYDLEEEIFKSNSWSEGKMLTTFEEKFGEYTKLGARAVSNGGLHWPRYYPILELKVKMS